MMMVLPLAFLFLFFLWGYFWVLDFLSMFVAQSMGWGCQKIYREELSDEWGVGLWEWGFWTRK